MLFSMIGFIIIGAGFKLANILVTSFRLASDNVWVGCLILVKEIVWYPE